MQSTKQREEERKDHTEWLDTIKERNDELTNDWWPFVQNIEDILERMTYMMQRFEDLDNLVGEVDGRIKNLRKILIKLEIVDDRFVF